MYVRGGGVRKRRRKRKKRGGGLIGGNPNTWTPSYLRPRGGGMRRIATRMAASFMRPLAFGLGGKRGGGMGFSGSGMAIHGAGLRGKRVLPRRGRGKRMI
jgi:hypothetical protein